MFNDPRTIETTRRENLVTTLISTQAAEPIPATVNGESVRITGVLTSVVRSSNEDGRTVITNNSALRALVIEDCPLSDEAVCERIIRLNHRGLIAEPEIEQAIMDAISRNCNNVGH